MSTYIVPVTDTCFTMTIWLEVVVLITKCSKSTYTYYNRRKRVTGSMLEGLRVKENEPVTYSEDVHWKVMYNMHAL